jgi:hypothetical protein
MPFTPKTGRPEGIERSKVRAVLKGWESGLTRQQISKLPRLSKRVADRILQAIALAREGANVNQISEAVEHSEKWASDLILEVKRWDMERRISTSSSEQLIHHHRDLSFAARRRARLLRRVLHLAAGPERTTADMG